MARGAAKTAQNQTGIENAVANQRGQRANDIYGALSPQLLGDINNPTGYNPQELAAMRTASTQGIGGATAGSVGQGNLEAARTRNAGGYQAANAEAARSGQRQISQNEVGIESQNAQLAQQKRSQALAALQGLYNTNVSGATSALGLVPGTINAWTNADQATTAAQQGWTNTALKAAGTIAAGAAGCWIAEALYGIDDPRTHLLRSWLNLEFKQRAFGRIVMAVYLRYGQRIAAIAKKSIVLRIILRPLFELALSSAIAERTRG